MSKTYTKQAKPQCALCETLFFGNPLDQRAESMPDPAGRWEWVCESCCRKRNRADGALQTNAEWWHPIFDGKNCERCGSKQKMREIATREYKWVLGGDDWIFHCRKCYDQYNAQQYAYPCDLELLYCLECLFVIPAGVAEDAGWAVDPFTGEAYCFFCKLEPGATADGAVLLSCTSKTQEKIQVDHIRRCDFRWVILLTQILTLAAIGLDLRCITLLLASASLGMVTAKQFARENGLRELLEKKKVQT